MKIENIKARDIMQEDIIKAHVSMTVKELAGLFEAERITGAPVVEGTDRLIGVVSETDLVRSSAGHIRKEEEIHPFFRREWADDEPDVEPSVDIQQAHHRPEEETVEDIMTPWTISAYEDTPVSEIAATMVKQHIHRVLITDRAGTLKGIVTTMDVARAVAGVNGA